MDRMWIMGRSLKKKRHGIQVAFENRFSQNFDTKVGTVWNKHLLSILGVAIVCVFIVEGHSADDLNPKFTSFQFTVNKFQQTYIFVFTTYLAEHLFFVYEINLQSTNTLLDSWNNSEIDNRLLCLVKTRKNCFFKFFG